MKKIKTGRLASAEDRARVQELVTMYRQAQQSPDGRYCVNPDDEPENQSFICKDDPEHLLYMLCWRRFKTDHLCRLNIDQGLLLT